MTSGNVSHLNAAVEYFQLVLDQCPVSHPDHATALTNLAIFGCSRGSSSHLCTKTCKRQHARVRS
jgi:hypothetical protein